MPPRRPPTAQMPVTTKRPSLAPAPSLARRALPVLALGGIAGTLVFALDRPAGFAGGSGQVGSAGAATASTDGSGQDGAADTSAVAATDGGSSDGSSVASTVPSSPRRKSSKTTAGASTGNTSPATAAPSGTTKSTTKSTTKTTTKTTSGSSASAPSASNACKSYSGPTIQTRFGPVQVKASVSASGKICSVSVLQHPDGGRSGAINGYAVPILNSEAMSAQSANIQGVSGATVTSRAYRQSLQAILDGAHG